MGWISFREPDGDPRGHRRRQSAYSNGQEWECPCCGGRGLGGKRISLPSCGALRTKSHGARSGWRRPAVLLALVPAGLSDARVVDHIPDLEGAVVTASIASWLAGGGLRRCEKPRAGED